MGLKGSKKKKKKKKKKRKEEKVRLIGVTEMVGQKTKLLTKNF